MSVGTKPGRVLKTLHFFNAAFYAQGWTPKFNIPNHEVTTDKRRLLECDCVVLHAPSLTADEIARLPELRRIAPKRQIWVLESEESSDAFSVLGNREVLELVDYEMSYRQTADIWTPYIPRDFEETYRTVTCSRRPRQCCAFISSQWNFSRRHDYLTELMEHVRIDSFGRALRNKRLWFDRGISTKMRLLRKYGFALAFENSITPDYVTEKFYQPLATGTVPVYLGAPNISAFAPGEGCFVNVSDFRDPADLGKFLSEVDPMDFQTWRSEPLRDEFRAMLDRVRENKLKRLSDLLSQRF